jgi:hypothetical protein
MLGECWWTWSEYGVPRTQGVRGVKAPEASEPDFTGVTVPQASPSNVRGWGAELGTGGRG